MKLISIAIVIAAFVVISTASLYLLKVNQVTSVASEDPKIVNPDRQKPTLAICVTNGPAYTVDGKQYDLSALKNLLVRDGRPVESVAIKFAADKGVGPAIALLEEIRRLGINDVRLDQPSGISKSTPSQ